MPIAIFWFRRDLRPDDNAALSAALRSGLPVLPLFIYDRDILDRLEDRDDARVTFIHQTVLALRTHFEAAGGTLLARYGRPVEVMARLLAEHDVAAVYANHDYEPYAEARDTAVRRLLEQHGVAFHTCKDHVIFERMEVVSGGGTPYTVFTPYSRKWRSRLAPPHLAPHPCTPAPRALHRFHAEPPPTLAEMGFTPSSIPLPSPAVNEQVLAAYARQRDFPAVEGTTRLGLHLRFGTVGIRQAAALALRHSDAWLNELIWRDFYAMILANFPHVEKHAFRPAYDRIPWRNDAGEYQCWCEGRTGYPIVDAGMRQLNATGFMHNRVRMVAASFLVKHLLVDWRWGEAYFARKLLDFDLASNNGSWQWAAGSGCDAAPYFRVFSPDAQTVRFDKAGQYIRRWVPEAGTPAYPKPVVEHAFARDRALRVYREALATAGS